MQFLVLKKGSHPESWDTTQSYSVNCGYGRCWRVGYEDALWQTVLRMLGSQQHGAAVVQESGSQG